MPLCLCSLMSRTKFSSVISVKHLMDDQLSRVLNWLLEEEQQPLILPPNLEGKNSWLQTFVSKDVSKYS